MILEEGKVVFGDPQTAHKDEEDQNRRSDGTDSDSTPRLNILTLNLGNLEHPGNKKRGDLEDSVILGLIRNNPGHVRFKDVTGCLIIPLSGKPSLPDIQVLQ